MLLLGVEPTGVNLIYTLLRFCFADRATREEGLVQSGADAPCRLNLTGDEVNGTANSKKRNH